MHVGLVGLGVLFLEVLERSGPGERANHVGIDAVGTPLGGGDARQAADAFLGCGVSALAVVAEQTGAAGEVHHGALRLLQVRVTRLHVVEGSVQAGIQRQVELGGGVVGDGDAGSGCLSVVHQRIDAPELGHDLVDGGLHDGLVVGLGVHVGLDGQHADAELALKTLLGGFELLHVTAGDGKVCALFGEGGGDAEPDGARGTVLQRCKARAGDDDGFAGEVTHVRLPSSCALGMHANGRNSQGIVAAGFNEQQKCNRYLVWSKEPKQ